MRLKMVHNSSNTSGYGPYRPGPVIPTVVTGGNSPGAVRVRAPRYNHWYNSGSFWGTTVAVVGLAALVALAGPSIYRGGKNLVGKLSSLVSSNDDPSIKPVYDGKTYDVYDLNGAEFVRKGNYVYDMFEGPSSHEDIGENYTGTEGHMHRERADAVVLVVDLDKGKARTVAQEPGSPIRVQ